MADSKKIQDYYQIITPKDLIGGFQKKSLNTGDSSIYEKAMDLIVNSDRIGALTFSEIIKELHTFSSGADGDKIHDVIQVYCNDDKPASAKYNPKNIKISTITGEQKPGTKIGVIFSNSPFISLNLRHMNHVTTFLTAIPTIELSKAVPFIDINFQLKSDSDGPGSGKHRALSLIKFLEGSIEAKGASRTIAKSYDKIEKSDGSKVVESDMGIFTAPQTLVNPDLNFVSNSDNSIAAVIGDKFRPLASLVSVNIDVVSSPSYTVAYKTIKMSLILHDRTRLAEIANLIRPATYTGTSMVIRYGWSHPDNPNTNPYAELIDQMHLEERYNIKNASYSFDEVGQVKIELILHMQGENHLWLSRISESGKYKNAQKNIESIKTKVFELIQDLGIQTESNTRVSTVLGALNTSTSATPLDKATSEEITKFISNVRSSSPAGKAEQAGKLAELLQGALDASKKEGIKSLKDSLKNTVVSAMQGKFTALQSNPDPFLPDPTADLNKIPYSKNLINAKKPIPGTINKNQYAYASLAKIFSIYILEPLRETGSFDEVQVIFYSFNDYCGDASGTNIGQFPVKISIFKNVMDDQLQKKDVVDMSVGSFGKLLNDAFIADPSALAYGLSSQYTPTTEGIAPPKVNNASQLESEMDKFIKKSGGGSWKNPTVEFYIECLSKKIKKTADRNLDSKTGTGSILRIHVYDKQSTPWDGFMKLKGSLSIINSTATSKSATDSTSQIQKAIQDLKDTLNLGGASIDIKDGAIVTKNFNIDKIKRLISAFVPTLTYGSNNTGIIKANLQSIQEPRLATVNQMRQNSDSNVSPNGSGVSGLPLRVIPGQISMQLIGCPLLSINQQFFIDFGTNTDLDNFYSLTGLSHTISDGKFETSAKFIWSDAYGSYETVASQFKQIGELIKKTQQTK